MPRLTVFPGALSGEVQAPPSKSILHRALICSALAGGKAVFPTAESDDIRATLSGLRSLGAAFREEGQALRFAPRREISAPAEIDCLESGSTLRFLLPLSLALCGGARFRGRGRLASRPLDPYRDLFVRQGISWEKAPGEKLDLQVCGRLHSGEFPLRGDVSSQFVTGLLLALPLLEGDSRICLTTPLQSASYVDCTLEVLQRFGIRVDCREDGYFVPGGQVFRPVDFQVEGDWSQAAVWLAADALGARIWVCGMSPDSRQGDRVVLDILGRMGAEAVWEGDRVLVRAQNLHGTTIDAADCPDIIPILALAASRAAGVTVIENAARLRLKECDRLEATCRELTRLGARAEIRDDRLIISGGGEWQGCAAESYGDHRMAMFLAIAGAGARGPVEIPRAECVAKSYPDFFDDFARLGGRVHEQ